MGFIDRIFGSPGTSCIEEIVSIEDLDEIINNAAQPVVLYKHSSTCGSSMFSRREIEAVTDAYDGPVFMVVVQRSRGLSNEIADRFGIRHETPQVIVVCDGVASFHRSHSGIRHETILKELESPASHAE